MAVEVLTRFATVKDLCSSASSFGPSEPACTATLYASFT